MRGGREVSTESSLKLKLPAAQRKQGATGEQDGPAVSALMSEPRGALERKQSTSELLPPIGIKPVSPSYSLGSRQENGYEPAASRRIQRSPLSPASTTSSLGGSSKSNYLSSSAGLTRCKGDVTNASNGKLETLYELNRSKHSTSAVSLTAMKINEQGVSETDSHREKIPPIDRHMNLKSTETIPTMHQAPLSRKMSTSSLPATSNSKPSLTTNRLSQENLLKLKRSRSKPNVDSRESDNLEYDSDDQKEQMIVNWLIGVETSQTEQPPEVSEIATNEKRDTAIHIVYEGD